MYCNCCLKQIPKDLVVKCSRCGAPLCNTCANHCMTCNAPLCDSCYAEGNYRCENCTSPSGNSNDFSSIRRSYLEQYAGCPHSLKLQLIEHIIPPMSNYAQLGIIVHEIIERISSKENSLNLQQALAMLEERINEWNLATDDEYSIINDELFETGRVSLKNFWLIKNELNTGKFISEQNIKYSVSDDLPMISCTLDRIRWDKENNIHIHDWKTGKTMSGQRLAEDLQPPLYIKAVAEEYGTYPLTFNLHYLAHQKHIQYKRINDTHMYQVQTSRSSYILDVDEAIGRAKDILSKIQANKFPIPKQNWRCEKMCWYGATGKCKKGTVEQWNDINKQYNKEE